MSLVAQILDLTEALLGPSLLLPQHRVGSSIPKTSSQDALMFCILDVCAVDSGPCFLLKVSRKNIAGLGSVVLGAIWSPGVVWPIGQEVHPVMLSDLLSSANGLGVWS